MLYPDDLVLIAETLEDLKKKLTIWKDNIEVKVNKTKLVCSKHNSSVKSDPVRWPCSICRRDVGINSTFCRSCNHWFCKRCSKIKVRLKDQSDPLSKIKVIIGNDKFEVVGSFHYLGDSIGQLGSCFEGTAGRVIVDWKNFQSLLPVLTNSGILLKVRGHAYNACLYS